MNEGTLVETALSRELRAAVGAAMQEFQDSTFIDEANHRYHCGGSSCADRLTPIFAKHGIGLLADATPSLADYRASLAAEDGLGAAWAAVEAVLPERWELHLASSIYRGGWVAYANEYALGRSAEQPPQPMIESEPFPGSHPTPTAALRALRAALTSEATEPRRVVCTCPDNGEPFHERACPVTTLVPLEAPTDARER